MFSVVGMQLHFCWVFGLDVVTPGVAGHLSATQLLLLDNFNACRLQLAAFGLMHCMW